MTTTSSSSSKPRNAPPLAESILPDVAEVETFSKPGTADVTPADRKNLKGLIGWARSQAHPFGACKKKALSQGLSEDHANRRCAVLKALALREELEEELVEELEELVEFLYGPDEVLGRAARDARLGGHSIAGGFGVSPKGGDGGEPKKYVVVSGTDELAPVFDTALAAVAKAYSEAGASTHPDSPGGKKKIDDPAKAAKVAQLDSEINSVKRSLSEEPRRSPFGLPSSSWADDNYVDRQRRRLSSLQRERRRILANA